MFIGDMRNFRKYGVGLPTVSTPECSYQYSSTESASGHTFT